MTQSANPSDEDQKHPRYSRRLLGHETAERLFLDAFNSGRVQHGWLITGPKGVGKASFAWKVAKFLAAQGSDGDTSLFGDVTQSQSLDVEDEHPAIRRILAKGHADIHELAPEQDAKSGKLRKDISVDQVRQLIDRFNRTSAEGGWRVAIVDAVDQMNRSAANALLKLLEEPPEKTILLLICHAPGKLLPTIRSRCRALPLKPLSLGALSAVLVNRFPDLSTADLQMAAQLSEGAPGTAMTLLEDGGLDLYKDLLQTVDKVSAGDLGAAHQFADRMTGKGANAGFEMVKSQLVGILGQVIRKISGVGDPSVTDEANTMIVKLAAASSLDHWLELWEKVAHRFERMEAVNLDKRQVIVSLFSDIYQTCQRPGS